MTESYIEIRFWSKYEYRIEDDAQLQFTVHMNRIKCPKCGQNCQCYETPTCHKGGQIILLYTVIASGGIL